MFNSIIKLVDHKDFIVTLSRREIISQYKQSILGNLWIIIQPLGLLVVMTVVFSLFVHLPSEGVPYAAFLFVVLLPWIFFNSTVNSSSGIITGYAGLIRQRQFYRPALVFSKLLSAIVSFFLSLIGLIVVFLLYQVQPGLNAFFAIPIFIIQVILMLGLMLFLSASNAYIRDFGLVTPLVLRIGRYLSPVIYSYQTVPEKYQIYLAINPLTGIFDGYRKTLLHNQQPDWFLLLYSFIFSLVLLGIGWITFIKLENNFADVV